MDNSWIYPKVTNVEGSDVRCQNTFFLLRAKGNTRRRSMFMPLQRKLRGETCHPRKVFPVTTEAFTQASSGPRCPPRVLLLPKVDQEKRTETWAFFSCTTDGCTQQ